jgi:arylsulfatase A-like enzyme
LVIKWPHGVPDFKAEVTEPMSLVDLVPTLVDGLALSGQQGGYQGRSLIPLVFDGAHRQEPLWATTRRVDTYQKPPRPLEMLQAGPWKILYDPLADRSQIYQIEDDPGESRDLSMELPMRALYLRQALLRQETYNRELLRQDPEPGFIEDSDAEIQEQLEALGYIN